ncbi:hypothetical protein ACFVVX_13615 [Kitasatospora sp. NPDC058170]|uniref:hypothetical protein n=1 Tax=Kitasatospora sp. NPDC058170 TaxID=3346364 RepID=UPI0036DD6A95
MTRRPAPARAALVALALVAAALLTSCGPGSGQAGTGGAPDSGPGQVQDMQQKLDAAESAAAQADADSAADG